MKTFDNLFLVDPEKNKYPIGTIFYKVVGAHERQSIMAFNYSKQWFGKYRKVYNKQDIVEADPKSLGLLCFISKQRAIEFQAKERIVPLTIIITVKSLTKPMFVTDLFCPSMNKNGLELLYNRYYKNNKPFHHPIMLPPKGTVSCMKVEVLT